MPLIHNKLSGGAIMPPQMPLDQEAIDPGGLLIVESPRVAMHGHGRDLFARHHDWQICIVELNVSILRSREVLMLVE